MTSCSAGVLDVDLGARVTRRGTRLSFRA